MVIQVHSIKFNQYINEYLLLVLKKEVNNDMSAKDPIKVSKIN